eukprot:COSAG04_NODE_223_length_19649_cov_12.486650_8_plen_75_part_00
MLAWVFCSASVSRFSSSSHSRRSASRFACSCTRPRSSPRSSASTAAALTMNYFKQRAKEPRGDVSNRTCEPRTR